MKHLVWLFLFCCGLAHSACDWSNPGAARYTGDLEKAVHAYSDIPMADRVELAAKLKKHQFDDFLIVGKSGIVGAHDYSDLRDMHWARGMCNGPVQRDKWKVGHTESALVYCSKNNHCVVVPSVCGNLARVTRTLRESAELSFEPPSAGLGGQDVGSVGGSAIASVSPADVVPSDDTPSVRSFAANSYREALRPAWFSPAPVWSNGGGVAFVPRAPISPVPEPHQYLLFFVGIVAIMVQRNSKGKHRGTQSL